MNAVTVGVTTAVSAVVLLVCVDALWRRRAGRSAGSGRSAGGDRRGGNRARNEDKDGIWAAIPSWQYNGLYAETGASTRGEQEKALRETREKAAETERQLRKRSK